MKKQDLVTRSKYVAAFAVLVASLSAGALAGDNTPKEGDTREQRVLSTRTFLNAHPDLKHRTEGWVAYDAGDDARAMKEFKRAALYSDKLSQAMVAELLWQGRGLAIDRAAAYAWADIAAERGYTQFVRLREQYWRQLDVSERARALEVGNALLAEYGDAAAKPRLALFMKKARQRMRRSAPYASAPKSVMVAGSNGGMISIPAHRFYDKKFWDPVQYQAWQDSLWMPPKTGQVDVGDVQQVTAPEQQVTPPED